jgi:TonB family protein
MHRSILIAACLALPALAPRAAAQATPAVWHTLAQTPDGLRLAVDSVTLLRTSDSTYLVRTATWYPAPLQLAEVRADREVDSEELDCVHVRSRGIEAALYLGEERIFLRTLTGGWTSVPEGRLPMVDAVCGYLLAANLAAAEPIYELSAVTQQPRLVNAGVVQRALDSAYPQLLRNGGVTGTVTLRFAIAEDGSVLRETVGVENSTHPDFEAASRSVVYVMRFAPAKVQGRPVRVWVTLPISFQAPAAIEATPTDTRSRLMGPPVRP